MIQFQVGMDASKLVSGNSQVKQEINSTGKLMEDVFGRKLKQVISVVAIEQAVQRTAEWSQQIEQAAKNLGTTAEQLQTLNHIASATGIADSAVTGLFDNIQKSAQDAIKGNGDLIASFAKLGISVGDLMNMSNADIFSKVVSTIPKDIRTTSDQYMRQSVQNITGTPENTLMSIQAGYNATPGKDLTDKGNNLKKEGAIAPEEDIQELSAIWAETLTSLKELGKSLLFIVTILVSLFKTIVDAISGVETVIEGALKSIYGLFTGDMTLFKTSMSKVFGILINGAYGIAKTILGLLSHIPGLKGIMKTSIAGIESAQNSANEYIGVGETTKKRGEAVSDVASMVLTGGDTALAVSATRAAELGAGIAKKVGMGKIATALETTANNASTYVMSTMSRNTPAITLARKAMDRPVREFIEEMSAAKDRYKGLGEDTLAYETAIKDDPAVIKATAKMNAHISMVAGGVGVAGLLGIGISGLKGITNMQKDKNIVASQNTNPIGMPLSFQQMAGGSANLKMGGMFGTGSLMDKLVSLNQKMAENLGTIAKNTSHGKPGGINDAITNHTKQLQSHGYMPGGGGGGGFGGSGAGGGW